MLSGVTVSCFLLSYAVVLVVEALRFAFKIPARTAIVIGFMVAGVFAHTVFLGNQLFFDTQATAPLLSNWFQWLVIGAWGLSLACLFLIARNSNSSVGLFLIPLVLVLIGLAQLSRGAQPFQAETTITVWRAVHGVSLAVGTMFICLGLSFGLMYIVKSVRLKSKRGESRTLRLPALEFLQSMNRLSLFTSAIAMAVGLLSGVILNINRSGHIAWFSGSILVTFALSMWCVVAAIMELLSRGSLGGRRSAYLTMANFAFLVVVMTFVLLSSHGQADGTSQPAVDAAPSEELQQ